MFQLIIVEDDEITKEALSDYISKTCDKIAVCAVFSNGEQALNYMKSHTIHIVLTDIKMPKLDGLALCKEIQQNYPICQMVIISGYGTFQYARQALQYGVKNYLLKPIDFKELKECLSNLTDSLDTLSISTNTQEEDIALLFTDIVCGMYKSPLKITEQLHKLQLPFSANKHSGYILRLSLAHQEEYVHWQYEKDRLPYAFANVLRMTLKDTYVINFFTTGPYFYFAVIFLESKQPVIIEKLTDILYELFHIRCKLEIITDFSNINQLAALNILENVSEVKEEEHLKKDENAIIQTVKNYIYANYDKDISRQDVADLVYFSPAYFSRFFKEHAGVNFIDYLTSVRMEKAIELLNSNLSIDEISRRVGYKSRNRFILNFRQYTSLSPSEYRKHFY